ncbi:hypothetical protein CNMCM5793_000311 [Aspergillus hiratsukae]|uniref:Alpha-1,3-glucanase/mutanase n=1 Tax=Aspergillus hiratsukae TaxID=1194566 RepID=A0A8H6UZW6_9EURO|nr:hypothetical protein CNMCM5793_000311 [Aspergillus hiratsukae]KAF7168875.1 hypothetical protein CNMCM6106_003890 [Aspergillus hiratsukae]
MVEEGRVKYIGIRNLKDLGLSSGGLVELDFGNNCLSKFRYIFSSLGNIEVYFSGLYDIYKSFGEWEDEIQIAQSAQIDGFALNFANEENRVLEGPLLYALVAAGKWDFKIIFSFDYAGNGPFTIDSVVSLLVFTQFPAYYRYRGKPLVSTFEGPANAKDWAETKKQVDCFFKPDWSSLGAKDALALGTADGLFSWAAWPWGNTNMDTYVDASYLDFLGRAGNKPYMMPVSPWFYTNLPGYKKDWLWRGDDLWRDRWEEVMVVQPDLVQIISWNDFGESHYIGPLPRGKYRAFEVGRAPYDYITGMPHDAWRNLLPYWIDTYKNGKASISEESIEFHPAEVAHDRIFFSAVLASEATVSVTVGGVALAAKWEKKPSGGVGVYHGSVAYGGSRGPVQVTISRSGSTIASFTGKDISASCTDGYTNWNAWIGSATGPKLATAVSPKLAVDEQKCVKGTAKGNFQGLCEFTCQYGYCPIGACVCLELGPPKELPKATGVKGYPIAGEGSSYTGLCDFACNYGYCPPNACGTTEVVLTEPTVSPHCTCTSTGTLVLPPAADTEYNGTWILDGDDSGLCTFACSRTYCPETACKRARVNEVPMCNDDSTDPECMEDAEACDISLTFNTWNELEKAKDTIPSGCMGVHSMQVLLKILKDTKANYTAVDNEYDYWFDYYIKYMNRVVPEQIRSFVSWGDKGPGNKYFDCTLIDGEQHQPQTCPVYGHSPYYTIDYDLKDELGFWTAVEEQNILKEWITFEDYDVTTPCIPAPPPNACQDSKITFWDAPRPARDITFANPKDIITKSSGQFEQLELDIATTWTEMMFAIWDGDYDDTVEALSLPVFMLAQAVESMEHVKQLGKEEKEHEEEELVMTIVTAILMVVPFAGGIIGQIAGIAWVTQALFVLEIVGSTALGVYDVVKNEGDPAMAVSGLLLGAAGARTGKNYASAATKRREIDAADIGKLGDVFKRHDDAFRRLIPANRFCTPTP